MGARWVRYGREAADALRSLIATVKRDEPLAPVTVVVPTNHVGVATRRLLASGRLGRVCGRGVGLAAVSFLTPFRLAELLGAPALAAQGRRPVSMPVVAAAVRQALADRPGLFAPVAEHPATEAALVATYRELREVSPAGLDRLAGAGPRAAEVVRLHRAVRDRLGAGWYDQQDLVEAAIASLGPLTPGVAGSTSGATGAVAAELGAVVVYLPQRLPPHGARLLRALGGAVPLSVIAGFCDDEAADAEVVAAVAAVAPGAGIPLVLDGAGAGVSAERTRIVVTSDADDEVRAAVRAVVDAARTGTPLDRMAVLYAAAEPYARIVHDQLSAAGIAANGVAPVPVAGRVAGRVLLGWLGLAEAGFRRQDVFAWLSTAPLWHHGEPVPVTDWEQASREAGVVDGDDWEVRLGRRAARSRLPASPAAAVGASPLLTGSAMVGAPSVSAGPAAAGGSSVSAGSAGVGGSPVSAAAGLLAFMTDLRADMAAAVSGPRRWSEHVAWARARVDALVGGASGRAGWPVAEQKAAERVDAALDRLAALDAVEGPVSLAVFTRTITLELEDDLGRVGRFGEGVLVGPLSFGVGVDLDLVAVLGLVEGTCPAPVADDSLLPDDERARAGDELGLRAAGLGRQHRQFLATLAGSRRQVLGVPRGDLRRSTERVPSRFVLDVASQLAGSRLWGDELYHSTAAWVDQVPSFDGGLRRLGFPATEQEHRLRSLLAPGAERPGGWAATVHDDGVVGAGAELVASRQGPSFTRFDGNLHGEARLSPLDRVMSVTRLEQWASCPFAYLVHEVLGVRPVDNPEAVLRIDPADRGQLVHQALEAFALSVLARPECEQPGPDDRWTAGDRATLQAIGQGLCDRFEAEGVTGRALFWRRDRQAILADLDRFLSADDEYRARFRTRLAAAELSFGAPADAVGAVPVAVSGGRKVHFRGKADRVDRADDGKLFVLDYKTGKSERYRSLSGDDPSGGGGALQLAVYGAAARHHAGRPDAPVAAAYWFVSARGRFEQLGYQVDAGVEATIGDVLGTIVDGIEAGLFIARPTAVSSSPFVPCPACDPDGLGVAELRRAWDRKRDHPSVTSYAGLVEPVAAGAGAPATSDERGEQ